MTCKRLIGTMPHVDSDELIKERLSDAEIVRIVRQDGLLDRVYYVKQKEEEEKTRESEDAQEDRHLDELVGFLKGKKILSARVLAYDNHQEYDDNNPSMVEIIFEEGCPTILVDGLRERMIHDR